MKYLAALAVLILLRLSLVAGDAIEIKQRWIPGKKYFQTMRTEQASKMSLGGEEMDQSTTLTLELSLAVGKPVPGQPKRMTIRYEHTAVDFNLNGQKMGYDSAHPEANSDPLGFSKTIGATIGKELRLVLDGNDAVTSIENYDEFIKSLPPATGGIDLAQMYSRESLTQMLQQGGLYAMPGKRVAPGDSWPFKMELEMAALGKVAVNGTYTFKGMTDHNGVRCAELETVGVFSLALSENGGGDPELAALGAEVSGGKVTGTIWFDTQLGCARDTQLVHELTMSMTNPADPTAKILIPSKQHISVTLTKIEDAR